MAHLRQSGYKSPMAIQQQKRHACTLPGKLRLLNSAPFLSRPAPKQRPNCMFVPLRCISLVTLGSEREFGGINLLQSCANLRLQVFPLQGLATYEVHTTYVQVTSPGLRGLHMVLRRMSPDESSPGSVRGEEMKHLETGEGEGESPATCFMRAQNKMRWA